MSFIGWDFAAFALITFFLFYFPPFRKSLFEKYLRSETKEPPHGLVRAGVSEGAIPSAGWRTERNPRAHQTHASGSFVAVGETFQTGSKLQTATLIASSLVFYGCQKPMLVLLLIFSILINAISSYRVVFGMASRRIFWASVGVITNLGVLIFFKYSGLLYRTFFGAPTSADPVGSFLLLMPLPIGISFFTFQGIALVVDTYRSQKQQDSLASKNFSKHLFSVALFKAFFPQLVSGPIVKAREFLPQISEKKFRNIQWEAVFRFLVLGYFFKMVIADQLKDLTFWISYPYFQGFSSLTLIVMLLGYSIQIFADFAGYSFIAMGLAQAFGYELPINFNYPYISQSFSEFWKRWHISLSSWLREYLYFPLGGNRKGPVRTVLNLMIVMFLGGLWHGAAWSYAVWGTWHGLLLAIERGYRNLVPIQKEGFIISGLRMLFVFSLVTLGWLLFRLPNFHHVVEFCKSVYTQNNLPHEKKIIMNVLIYSLPVVTYHLFSLRSFEQWTQNFTRFAHACVYGVLIFLIIVNSGAPGVFIYFQF